MNGPMVEHFEDIHFKIKELSNVAAMVVAEAIATTDSIFEDRSFYPSVLEVLAHLVATNLNYDEMKVEYSLRKQQNDAKRQIDEALARQKQAKNF